MRLSLPPFNPDAQYIAARPLTLAGKQLKPGQAIPPGIDIRRVQQLFENRRVAVAPEIPKPPKLELPLRKDKK